MIEFLNRFFLKRDTLIHVAFAGLLHNASNIFNGCTVRAFEVSIVNIAKGEEKISLTPSLLKSDACD